MLFRNQLSDNIMIQNSNPAAYLKTAKNGLQCAFLKYHSGLSTIGVALKIGSQDSKQSGQTFLTLQSKLFDAIKSPEEAFKYGITPTLRAFNDYSVVHLQFIPECAPLAQSVLKTFLSKENPTHPSIIRSRYEMNNMQLFGLLQPQDILLSLAHSASFGSKDINTYTENALNVNPSQEIISSLQSRIIPFASSDMETNLLNIVNSLSFTDSKFDILPQRQLTRFRPGEITRAASKSMVSGSKLIQHINMSHAAFSFPAPSASHDDFYTFTVLERLFGGGSHFSSDGYGVGHLSLLHSQLLGRFFIEEARTVYTPGLHNGLLSFWFKADSNIFQNISRRLKKILYKATDNSLDNVIIEAAKEQAILNYLKSIDGGSDLFVDFGCRLIAQRKTRSSKEIIQKLENVSKDDVIRCAKKFLQSNPSIVLLGKGNIRSLSSPWM